MDQIEANERVADALSASHGYGFDHVATLARVPDAGRSAILVRCSDGSHLSVTVEVLIP